MKSVLLKAAIALMAAVAPAAEKPTQSSTTVGSIVVENAR